MSNHNKLKEEIARLIDEAFAARERGEYYDSAVRLKVYDDKPDWKVVISWPVETPCPTIVIRQRKL